MYIEGRYTIVPVHRKAYGYHDNCWYVTQHGKVLGLIHDDIGGYQAFLYPLGQPIWVGSYPRVDQCLNAIDDTLSRHRMPGAGGRC